MHSLRLCRGSHNIRFLLYRQPSLPSMELLKSDVSGSLWQTSIAYLILVRSCEMSNMILNQIRCDYVWKGIDLRTFWTMKKSPVSKQFDLAQVFPIAFPHFIGMFTQVKYFQLHFRTSILPAEKIISRNMRGLSSICRVWGVPWGEWDFENRA